MKITGRNIPVIAQMAARKTRTTSREQYERPQPRLLMKIAPYKHCGNTDALFRLPETVENQLLQLGPGLLFIPTFDNQFQAHTLGGR